MICNIIQRNITLALLLFLSIISHYFDLVKTSATQTFVKLFCEKDKINEKEISL